MTSYVPPPRFTFDEDGFVLPPFDPTKFPYIVAVAGGLTYTAADGKFVRRKVLSLVSQKAQTHNVFFHLAPSPGAARIIYDTLNAGYNYGVQVVERTRALWGRACDFRSAFALLDCASAVILFEPFDLIAHYSYRLAEMVPDRDGREGGGVKIAVVRKSGVLRASR